MAGKLVLVTGGARNVGKAIAARFAARGAHVIINFFHSLDESKRTAAALRDAGGQVDTIRASVAQKAQVDRMFDEIEAKYGRLDILVNNAASGALLGLSDITEEHFDKALNTNLKGAFWCSRRAAALMARGGGGAIVNVSSVGATLVPANYLVVGTSKAALEALTRYLAVEFAPLNIRVNTASSTLIDGDVAAQFPDPENTRRSSIAATPLRRLATADDMADLVVFLASDAARWVTGQVVVADGGLSLCSEGLSPRREWAAAAVEVPPQVPAPAPVPDPATIPETDDIAIVGMGVALPGANDPEAFWRILVNGPELFGEVPSDRWDYRSFYAPDPTAEDKSYQSRSVFITGFEPHPRLRAELAAAGGPRELTTTWLRHSLMQAMDGVRLRPGDRTSFLVGYTADGSQHLEEAMVLAGALSRLRSLLEESGAPEDEQKRCLAHAEAVLGVRYARGAEGFAEFLPHRVGLEAMRGVLPDDAEYMMVDTACSSSLYSVDLGMKALLLGKQDVAVCGGAFALAPRGSVLFSKLHGLSRSGEVRPLDRDCDGVLFADGAGVVVLKRLHRALADGDRVLAVIKGFGSSSDGRGKAIYAPSSNGQNLAIRRAYEGAGVEVGHIDWVVAHATGTPAGDLAEFQSLSEMFTGAGPVQVTSNKSLVGHTGWAAGVASLVQVVLALRHGQVPPQHRFTRAPDDFRIGGSALRIPTTPVAWPARKDRPRMAAVSGFGFGGTNGHLIVSEYRPELPPALVRPREPDASLVIVGWSARLPGLEGPAAVRDWLLGRGAAPLASFGDTYPLPPFERVRMSPPIMRALDRCQLMALEAAYDLREQLRAFWDSHANTIGVVMGHMGPTRNAALYASRSYLDDLEAALGGKAATPLMRTALAGLRERTRRLVPPTTENSFPGMMPNVIPARVANYFDLHGLNMTVDAGHASALAGIEVAARHLRSGELDMVLVGGINGNSAAEIAPASDVPPAEGLVLFAVMRQAAAEAAGLPVLAVIDSVAPDTADPPASSDPLRDRDGRVVSFLGADGALAVLRAVLARKPATTVMTRNAGDRARFAIRVADPAAATRTAPTATGANAATPAAANALVIAPPTSTAAPALAADVPALAADVFGDRCADGEPPLLRRYRIAFQEAPWQPGPPAIPFLPDAAVLVTDTPHLLDSLGPLPADLVVLSSQPLPQPRPGWYHVAVQVEALLIGLVPAGTRHVRLLSMLGAAELVPGQVPAPSPARLALHNLAFLALRQCYEALQDGGSFTALLLDSVIGDVLHPDAGLFSGLVKAMGVELPACRSLGVFTDTASPREAMAQAEHESGGAQLLPVVALSGGRRLIQRVTDHPARPAMDGAALLGPHSVVVAVGGARGVTAEAMKALARHVRPTLYLIGSTDLDAQPAATFEGTDEAFAHRRPAYIRERRAASPGMPLAQINKDFDRLIEARAARRNLNEMATHCGAGRVHYLRADVLDPASIQAAIGRILERERQVDLVVHAAGLSRTASVPVKSFGNFVAVRDIKVRGYWNLRAAFAGRQPRAWCSFGSFIGLTGQSGETDYASGNDFLNTQAAYHRTATGEDEFCIGWTLWRSVGMGANPVTAAFLKKSGLFTGMRTEEGVYHFLREIGQAQRDAASVHLGDNERRAILAHLPGFFDPVEPLPPPAAVSRPAGPAARPAVSPRPVVSPGFYLGREMRRNADSVQFERVFDLDADGYLAQHVVNGFPTLPGTFVPEIAAEVATQLIPDWVVAGFEDVVFHHFLRVYDARRPSTKRIEARVVRRTDGQALIAVRVTGDVTAPDGRVLVRDKLHFEAKVLMAAAYEPAPQWPHWPAMPETPVIDPYHLDAAAVHLSGVFVSTGNTRMTTLGKRARYRPLVAPDHPVFSRFIVPSILLDGLARIAVLNHVAGDYIPLAAPAAIRRIDIYEAGNDCSLPLRHDPIELYATPREFALEGASPMNRFVAVRPDGRMLLQMKDIAGVIIGYVHRGTGAFVAKAEVDAILAGGVALAEAAE
jgi:3-oxoacyl-(acyl-carrier-protein) synthase/NAD(P)-dependent dehydrogenase (short-subunit alcohol dehydrogenase family)